jgi:hypothetical protein
VGCDVLINSGEKRITYLETGESVYYVDAFDNENRYPLVFAAIFSNKEIYECHLKRLLNRASELADLYSAKSNYLTTKGCSSAPVLPAVLRNYQNAISSYSSSTELNIVYNEADTVERKNEPLACALY